MKNGELDADGRQQADPGGQGGGQAVQSQLPVYRVAARPVKVDHRHGDNGAEALLTA